VLLHRKQSQASLHLPASTAAPPPCPQFTTSFTFYIHRERRLALSSFGYSLHAIFSHGKDKLRKMCAPPFCFRKDVRRALAG